MSGLPNSITMGDFNGDGRDDLATGNLLGTVSILLGRGNGTFRAAVDIAVGVLLRSVTVGDFNGDGRQDLAAADSISGRVSILLGLGDGTFRAPQDFVVGAYPASVTVGDFNGDGRQDVAAGNADASTVSILLGLGDGTFQAAEDFAVGARPWAITGGDFNGDGRQDLVTANVVANTLSILLNNTSTAIVVTIDIKPGNFPNSINPKSNGEMTVAILTTTTFNATSVDPLSVKFGRRGATEAHGRSHIEDADSDGDLDLVLHFRTPDTGIACGDTSASLTGETFGGQMIKGADSIKTVGCQ